MVDNKAATGKLKRGKHSQPASPEVRILMLGFQSWGKTLLLAALFKQFRMGPDGITLLPDNATEREFGAMLTRIGSPQDPFLPEATPTDQVIEWSFQVQVTADNGATANACTLYYTDYAGEYAEALTGAGDVESMKFNEALKKADVLLGVLDGELVHRLLLTPQGDPDTLDKIERLLRLLVRSEQRCIHLVISKWDLMVDSGRVMGIDEVVERLREKSEAFKTFLENSRFKLLRVIPVAALGYGFMEPSGKKTPEAIWSPLHTDAPFYAAIPDILAGDMSQASQAPQNGRTVLNLKRLANVTMALLSIVAISYATPAGKITLTVTGSEVVSQIRQWAGQWRKRTASTGSFDTPDALARMIEVCYSKVESPHFPQTHIRAANGSTHTQPLVPRRRGRLTR